MRHLFNHDFTQQRLISTTDPEGVVVETWQTIGTIRGRLRPANVQETYAAASLTAIISHIFYCGPEVDIRKCDRVTLGDTTVEITAVKNPSYVGHHLECEGKVIQ